MSAAAPRGLSGHEHAALLEFATERHGHKLSYKWGAVILDDADGHILHAKFVEQEGTVSTLAGLKEVLREHGRFCEFYHDRGSHFGRTSKAGQGPDEEQKGHVTRV